MQLTRVIGQLWGAISPHCSTVQHAAVHCNTLKHIAAHCSTVQNTATSACVTAAEPCYKYWELLFLHLMFISFLNCATRHCTILLLQDNAQCTIVSHDKRGEQPLSHFDMCSLVRICCKTATHCITSKHTALKTLPNTAMH